MRRIIHNTTAIAACLSLLVPQLAQAQAWTIDSDPTAKSNSKTPMPAPLVLAQAEEPVPPLPPADQPEAEAEAEVDAAPPAEADPAEAVAEEATASEPAAEANAPEPSTADMSAVSEEPAPVEPVAEEAPAAPVAAPEESVASEPAAEVPAAETSAPETVPEPVAEPEPAPVAAEEPAVEDQAPEDQATESEPVESQAPAAEMTADDATGSDSSSDAPIDAASEQTDAAEGTVDPSAEPAAQEDQPLEAAEEQQSESPAPGASDDASMPADPLAEALEAEQAADEPVATPADPAVGTEPSPTESSIEDALRDDLAAEQQPDGELIPETRDTATDATAVPAEANTPVTEAAQQAAEETRAAPAAALDDEVQGEVVEQQITEENSRSSDEDFATSLRDALQPQSENNVQPAQTDSGDDNDNDLAKALLLGLGAVAVGAYLNNNRQVTLSAPDRVVVTRPDGSQEVIKDEVALLRQPGSTVTTENFDDGSSRTVVIRADGSRVVTIRDADLRVLRRTLVSADGTQTRLIDDTAKVEPVDIATLPAPAPAPVNPVGIHQDEAALREALRGQVDINRRFTLGQVRSIPEVRALVPPVTIDAITFETGSAAITPDQARQLSTLGNVIGQTVAENPREMFLIEGHTDTVGSDAANLALSDRRAESVALALAEYFDVPPENLVVQGYGERFLQVRQEGDVRENRRAAVRQITNLLQTASAQ